MKRLIWKGSHWSLSLGKLANHGYEPLTIWKNKPPSRLSFQHVADKPTTMSTVPETNLRDLMIFMVKRPTRPGMIRWSSIPPIGSRSLKTDQVPIVGSEMSVDHNQWEMKEMVGVWRLQSAFSLRHPVSFSHFFEVNTKLFDFYSYLRKWSNLS